MDLVMAAPAKSSSPHRIKVKKEVCSETENIKDFAETAMNDILGWYGYGDSVDRIDIALSSSTPAVGSESNRSSSGCNKDNNGTSKGSSTMKPKHNKAQQQQHKPRQFNMRQHNSSELSDTIATVAVIASGIPSPSALLGATASCGNGSGGGVAGGCTGSASNSIKSRSGGSTTSGSTTTTNNNNNNNTNSSSRNGVNLHHHGDSSTSEKDSSRESSKSPMLLKMLDKQEPICQWCRRGVPPNHTGILGTTEGTIFCSESCFSQSRRASFKRAKTCDWCRHVRHAVSYVDFQDGVTQLQFCSEKCLNQYKMQIFCNETQAHLDMNPHLKEKSASTGSLITPDLWLKNCKSRSVSPVSDRSESISPAPSLPMRPSPEPVMPSPSVKKPIISVAPPSKLLSKNVQAAITRTVVKSTRKRRSGLRPHQQTVLHCRRNPNSKLNIPQGNNNNNSDVLNNNLAINSTPSISKPATSTGSNVQDLRTGIMISNLTHPTKFESRDSPSTPRPPLNAIPPPFLQLPPNVGMRHPFFPLNSNIRYGSPPSPQSAMPPPPPLSNPLTNLEGSTRHSSSIFGLPAPPVTILVPYPIVIPLPLPIPIPIPLIDFLKATAPKTNLDPSKVESATSESTSLSTAELPINFSDNREGLSEVEPEEGTDELPLDFTVMNPEQRRLREAEQTVTVRSYERTSNVGNYSLETINHGARVVDIGDRSPEQKLPKFKITRVNTRLAECDPADRSTSGGDTKESLSMKDSDAESREMVERSRPLRKRKRLVVHHEEATVVSPKERDSGDAKE
ncbi:sine oculis-binding protein homolog A [Malaya genurostris]|uniref:sine oculis-binding protein homolog A n=1 Tax=Malaya genurostris TaxID=325434 RepID=UPI0026F3867D|nr:sine oculis-binding protein homolog A [Malaya genurostris]